MQGMQRYDHKRKLTREEKRLDEEAKYFNLLLFSDAHGAPPSSQQQETTGYKVRKKTQRVKRKYKRLNTSPTTIPGTPEGKEEKAAKRPTRFPVPNYEHRNTNCKQLPLMERILLDDYVNGGDLFPTEWAEETGQKIPSPTKIITENDFDFTDAGFANELFRVEGQAMKIGYDTNKDRVTHSTKEDDSDSDSSTKSIRLYGKAYVCYKPEAGEFNAESAANHQLIDDRVQEPKETRRRKLNNHYPVRTEPTFATSTRLTRTILQFYGNTNNV
jgi:hypothetical protein